MEEHEYGRTRDDEGSMVKEIKGVTKERATWDMGKSKNSVSNATSNDSAVTALIIVAYSYSDLSDCILNLQNVISRHPSV